MILSPAHFGLSEIPIDNLRTPFWTDMVRAQEKGDQGMGILIVAGFVTLLGIVLSTIYAVTALPPKTGLWLKLVAFSFLLLFFASVSCFVKDTYQEWGRTIDSYRTEFEAAGYHLDFLLEITGPPNCKGISPKCAICRIWKEQTLDRQQVGG